MLKPKTSTL